MRPLTRQAINLLISREEVAAGFKEVEAETHFWGDLTLRMRVPPRGEGHFIFWEYVASQDRKALVGKLVDPQFAGAFLDELTPENLEWLAHVAVGVCLGPEELEAFVERCAAAPTTAKEPS